MRFYVSETYKSGCFSEYDENRSQTIILVWLFLYAGEGHSFLLNASDYLWYNIPINMG